MNRTLYTVPIAGGAAVQVVATRMARRVQIQEDDSTAQEGLIVKFPEDNFTQPYEYAPGHEPIILGSQLHNAKGQGNVLGWPIQKSVDGVLLRPATVYCTVTSMTATATKIRVEEFE